MKYCLAFLTFELFGGLCHSQNSEYPNIILSYSENQTLYFHEYNPPLKVKAEYTQLSQALNQYPEQLIQSILSAKNQNWVDYNTLGGTENSSKLDEAHFQKIILMDKEKNYFELVHKLTFNVGSVPTALVKFYFYQENQTPVSGCHVMQNINGRWQKTSHPSLSLLAIAFMRFKTEVIKGVILGGSKDQEVIKLRQRITTNGSFDLAKLEKEFSSWYSPAKDEKKLKLFTDPKAW
ncbi:MAG: hypothetical protein IM603_16485 [Cytophagales bacterium]|nr:hypothetical protein [Cytophagales bacterium]